MKILPSLLGTAVLFTLYSGSAEAIVFDRMISFGDSLSDIGNTSSVTNGFVNYLGINAQPDPLFYNNGRFTNGNVWLEYLAPKFGVTFNSTDDKAYAGAVTSRFQPLAKGGAIGIRSLGTQVSFYNRNTVSDPMKTLFTVWAGGNDYANAAESKVDPKIIVSDVVGNIVASVNDLRAGGAKYIIVNDVPDTSLTPLVRRDTPNSIADLHTATLMHERALETAVDKINIDISNKGEKGFVQIVKIGAFFQDVVWNPSAYGLNDVTTSCYMQGSGVNAYAVGSVMPTGSCGGGAGKDLDGASTHLFWDGFHPTAAGHELIADFTKTSWDVVNESAATLSRRFVAAIDTLDVTYKAKIGGSGTLVKLGPKMLILQGDNTYTGGTEINQGTVSISRDSNLGAPSGKLSFNGGILRNTAPMVSARAITLNGAADSKTAALDFPGEYPPYGGFGRFETLAPLKLTGSIEGPGDLYKLGGSILTIAGKATYEGTTWVRQGTLEVNGTVSETLQVFVDRGATLSGTGTVDAGITNSGTLAPGLRTSTGAATPPAAPAGQAAAPPQSASAVPSSGGVSSGGVLHVVGNVIEMPGSTLEIQVDTAQASALDVQGHFHAAGLVQLDFVPGDKVGTHTYTMATIANQDFDGAFDDVIDSNPFLQGRVTRDGDRLMLAVTRDFAMPAATVNQRALGLHLNTLYEPTPEGDIDNVFAALDNLTTDSQARDALGQLSGASLGDMTTGALIGRQVFARSLESRLAQRRGGTAAVSAAAPIAQVAYAPGSMAALGGQMAQAAQAGALAPGDGGPSAWARGLGSLGNVRGDGNGAGFGYGGGGVMVGVDTALEGGWVVGGSLGYASSVSTSNANADKVSADSYQLAVYGGWRMGRMFVDGQAAYSFSNYATRRNLAFGGLTRVAAGASDGNDLTMAVKAGLRWESGRLAIEPSLGLDWYRVSRAGFTETGAGSAGLVVGGQVVNALMPSLGAKASASFVVDEDVLLIPEARARYYHDFGDAKAPVRAALIAAPSAGFTSYGAVPGRDAWVLGAGLVAARGEGLRLFVDYELGLAQRQTSHAITGGVRYAW